MYKRVKRDGMFVTENGGTCLSVATLADEYGGRVQIAMDDGCYVLYVQREKGYRMISHIFPEAHAVLSRLRPPSEQKNYQILAWEVLSIERERHG